MDNQICYDAYSGQFFYTSTDRIRQLVKGCEECSRKFEAYKAQVLFTEKPRIKKKNKDKHGNLIF